MNPGYIANGYKFSALVLQNSKKIHISEKKLRRSHNIRGVRLMKLFITSMNKPYQAAYSRKILYEVYEDLNLAEGTCFSIFLLTVKSPTSASKKSESG